MFDQTDARIQAQNEKQTWDTLQQLIYLIKEYIQLPKQRHVPLEHHTCQAIRIMSIVIKVKEPTSTSQSIRIPRMPWVISRCNISI